MSSKEPKTIFVATMWIILGVDTRPNAQVCLNYVREQLLIPLSFDFLGVCELFDYPIIYRARPKFFCNFFSEVCVLFIKRRVFEPLRA